MTRVVILSTCSVEIIGTVSSFLLKIMWVGGGKASKMNVKEVESPCPTVTVLFVGPIRNTGAPEETDIYYVGYSIAAINCIPHVNEVINYISSE